MYLILYFASFYNIAGKREQQVLKGYEFLYKRHLLYGVYSYHAGFYDSLRESKTGFFGRIRIQESGAKGKGGIPCDGKSSGGREDSFHWIAEKGVVVISGSSNPDHIQENTEFYDFEVTEEEMERISGLDRNEKHDWY